jgi:glycosyltransferase involved in cell wall biosynthesis
VQNKVLQSFACGLPTVSTAMGVEGIACQAGEHFLVAETSDAFVRQVGELIEDAAQRKTLGAAASGLIQNHYSWEAQLATLGEHLEHTLEQVKT